MNFETLDKKTDSKNITERPNMPMRFFRKAVLVSALVIASTGILGGCGDHKQEIKIEQENEIDTKQEILKREFVSKIEYEIEKFNKSGLYSTDIIVATKIGVHEKNEIKHYVSDKMSSNFDKMIEESVLDSIITEFTKKYPKLKFNKKIEFGHCYAPYILNISN
ncbi:MAG: hypothetical protein WC356_07595 [Candidatus Micrarchaeia archaeon]|jgi:hypothetical protein